MDRIIRNGDSLDEPAELLGSVSYRIRLLQIAAYKSFETQVSGFGSAPRYYGMLKIIEANPGIPQIRLAEAIFLDRSSVVPILDRLTREGWIERKSASQDKRVRRVFLTPHGNTQLALLKREVTIHEAAVTKGLSEAEKEQLLSLLTKIDTNLRDGLANASRNRDLGKDHENPDDP